MLSQPPSGSDVADVRQVVLPLVAGRTGCHFQAKSPSKFLSA